MQKLNHKHIIVTARGLAAPPRDVRIVTEWEQRLVSAVNMQLLMGPYAIRCEDTGNEGVTGVVVISTSHASLHCWDECDEPFLKMDLYSCANFSSATVIEMIREFEPTHVEWMVIDRNRRMRVVETGATGPAATCAERFLHKVRNKLRQLFAVGGVLTKYP